MGVRWPTAKPHRSRDEREQYLRAVSRVAYIQSLSASKGATWSCRNTRAPLSSTFSSLSTGDSTTDRGPNIGAAPPVPAQKLTDVFSLEPHLPENARVSGPKTNRCGWYRTTFVGFRAIPGRCAGASPAGATPATTQSVGQGRCAPAQTPAGCHPLLRARSRDCGAPVPSAPAATAAPPRRRALPARRRPTRHLHVATSHAGSHAHASDLDCYHPGSR